MFFALSFLVFAGIVLSLVCVSFVQMELIVVREKDQGRIVVCVRGLYGLIQRRVEIPLGSLENLLEEVSALLKKSPLPQETPPPETISAALRTIWDFYRKSRALTRHVHGYSEWRNELLSHIRIVQFRWETSVGLGDAAKTAIVTGGIWGLKAMLLGMASARMKLMTEPFFYVSPHFSRPQFSTALSCIFKIRFGYSIIAGIALLGRILKAKGGLKIWRNTLLKG